jgi:hypothetical protein
MQDDGRYLVQYRKDENSAWHVYGSSDNINEAFNLKRSFLMLDDFQWHQCIVWDSVKMKYPNESKLKGN